MEKIPTVMLRNLMKSISRSVKVITGVRERLNLDQDVPISHMDVMSGVPKLLSIYCKFKDHHRIVQRFLD